MATSVAPDKGAINAAFIERLLEHPDLKEGFVRAVVAALRERHGSHWLVSYYDPDEGDRNLFRKALQKCVIQLADARRDLDFNELSGAADQWLTKHLRKGDRLRLLRDLTERVAARKTEEGKDTADTRAGIVLDPGRRIEVAEAAAQDLRHYMGPENLVATDEDVMNLANWLVQENLGAGALEQYLQDQSLTEIMVGNQGRIWVEKDGTVMETAQTLPDERARWFAQRLAALIGSRIDQAEPTMDGFLEVEQDGHKDVSRVHVILPPIAMDGVSITIRRHSKRPGLEKLMASGAVSSDAADFMRDAVTGMANLLISGGTSSGKTTILNIVAGFIGQHERVLTMEDAPELDLPLPHKVRLRTRKANIEGRGEFTMRMLVKESLRMRPDRIVVGEVRGAEALDMIEAMNTGHDGCLSTAHANGPLDMLKRLGQMMKRGDGQLTDSGAFELIAAALHLIVHAERRVSADGKVTRGVMEIVEVVGYSPDRPGTLGFVLKPIFQRGSDQVLRRVGSISQKLAEHLRLNGVDVSRWVNDDGR